MMVCDWLCACGWGRARLFVVCNEDDDEGQAEDIGEGDQQQKQKCSSYSSMDSQARDAAHREIYSPFVYAPDLIVPAHPFGVYALGTTPDLQRLFDPQLSCATQRTMTMTRKMGT